jgi:hypothetical protein
MKMRTLLGIHGRRGVVLADMLVGSAITAVIAAGMLTGIVSLQRSFRAANHHARSQIEQSRFVSYVARDLRRALSVNRTSMFGNPALEIKIPDFYTTNAQSQRVQREPTISEGKVAYGNPLVPVVITYYQKSDSLYRRVSTRDSVLASNVKDFRPEYSDSGGQIIGVSVSFMPKFKLNPANDGPARTATTVYATTLLRNERRLSD